MNKQLVSLFKRQGGLCYWCTQPMTLDRPKRHKKSPDNMATIEHLEDKWDPLRGTFNDGKSFRRVAACHKCNNGRSNARQADSNVVSKEELWRRSGRYPQTISNRGRSGGVLSAVMSALTRMAFWRRCATTDMA
jgi:hypothetical protein